MTTGADTKYETKGIHALRGLEARTIKKWQDDGWEVVSQAPGKLRTEITLRRTKPKPRPLPWIMGGTAVAVALAAITVGTISERNATPAVSEALTSTAISSAEPSESTATSSAEPSEASSARPSPDAAANAECSMSGTSAECKFGQTVIYTDTTREGDVALEITVQEPVSFAPSSSATFWNSRAAQVPALPVSIYFPVTIKNVATRDRDSSFIFTQATNTNEGETDVLAVSDGDVASYVSFDTLAPGESYSFNNGWTMSTLDGLEFEVSIDGLAGGRVTFTR